VDGAAIPDPNRFRDRLRGRRGRCANIVLGGRVLRGVTQVVHIRLGRRTKGFQRLERVLPHLRVRVSQGQRCQGGHGGLRIRAEPREFPDCRGRQPPDFRRRHLEQTGQFRQRGGVVRAAQGQCALDTLVVLLHVHVAVHVQPVFAVLGLTRSRSPKHRVHGVGERKRVSRTLFRTVAPAKASLDVCKSILWQLLRHSRILLRKATSLRDPR
jgi:hypothetical protein